MAGDVKLKQIIDSAEELARIYNTPEVIEICKLNQKMYYDINHRRSIYRKTFLSSLTEIKIDTIKII
jgi:hypothetical protein